MVSLNNIVIHQEEKLMNLNELAACLIKNHKLDFVGYAITPFHLSGLKAYISYLHDSLEREINGIVLIGKHDKAGYLLSTDISFEGYVHARVEYLEMEGKLKSLPYKGMKHDLKIVCPEAAWLNLSLYCKKYTNYNVKNVIVDDGMGSYLSFLERVYVDSQEECSICKAICFGLKRIIIKALEVILFGRSIKFSIFDKKHFMEPLPRYYYKNAIESGMTHSNINFAKHSVVYLGTVYPTSEEKIRREHLIGEILESYYNKGYKIYIKGHPREEVSFADVTFPVEELPQKISIEEMVCISEIKPEIVMGWNSSALVTLSALWKINCYSLSGIISEDINTIGTRQIAKMIKSNPDIFETLKFINEME